MGLQAALGSHQHNPSADRRGDFDLSHPHSGIKTPVRDLRCNGGSIIRTSPAKVPHKSPDVKEKGQGGETTRTWGLT